MMKKKLALSLDSLPHEIILKFGKHLKKADLFKLGQVCRSWRDVFRDPIFWRHVDIKNPIWHKKPQNLDNQMKALKVMLKLAGDSLTSFSIGNSKINGILNDKSFQKMFFN